jgi:ABC-type transporter Mla maintaining outer membrane lipid asymmetry ATPase subunit MlaF
MISVRRVSKRYGGVVALDDVSLDVARGTTHVLLGSSGSGKSTLLRIMLGLVVADAGEASIDGARVTPDTRRTLVGKVGYVVQEGGLFPHLTVGENIGLPAEAAGWPRRRMTERVGELAGLVGFDEALLRRYPAELSGGMRKRVGIARSLMMNPSLILFDEPGAGLDPVGAALIDELIVSLSEKSTTSIVVTHNLASAFRIATRVAMLHGGRILEEGEPDALRRSENPIVRQFVEGNPKGPLSQGAGA